MKTILAFIILISTAIADEKVINWHTLLANKNYTKIDSLLQGIHKEILNDPSKEVKLAEAYHILTLDKNLETNIKEYAKTKPTSPFSHLLLGEYYLYKGFDARGYKWAKDTPQYKFDKMRKLEKKAKEELLQSLKIDNTISLTYANLIATYTLLSNYKKRDEIYKIGLEKFANSYIIRKTYLQFSLIKWGGTFEKIKSLLKDAKAHSQRNPLLKKLDGYLEFAKADFYFRQKQDTKKGLKFINRALKLSDYTHYYYFRGIIYKSIKEYKKALKDFNLVIKRYPLDLDALLQRAYTYYFLKKYNLMFKDVQTILTYDYQNSYALFLRGIYYYDQEEYELATIDLLDSLQKNDSNIAVKKYLGYSYYGQKNYKMAAKYLQEALNSGSKDSDVAYYLTVSQWHNRDCNFVKSAYLYKDSCTKTNSCNQEWLDWAIKSAKYAQNRAICQ